ncbi:phasin family protein [Craterilacuibacter sp.]|uniref:phasin family protein n=1 Tax=Craterilacuibacter sp. TaxID=2870909 RepID=UPI003F35EDDA
MHSTIKKNNNLLRTKIEPVSAFNRLKLEKQRKTTMKTTQQQFSDLSLGHVETTLRAAQITLDSAERMIKFNLEVSKQTLEDNAGFARELSTNTDPQEIASRLGKMANHAAEKAVENARNFYELISQAQSAMTKLAEDNMGSFNKSLISSVETLAKNAPAGSETAINAIKTSLATSAAALNSVAQSAQQVAHFTDAGIKTAGNASAEAVKNAGSKRANA